MNLAFPYGFSALGLTAETTDRAHLRDLIEQVLFTSPGERLMRPDFGCGVDQLVFAPNSTELASATQMLVQSSLQQWLGDLIDIQLVSITAEDSALYITVRYSDGGDRPVDESFERPAGGAA